MSWKAVEEKSSGSVGAHEGFYESLTLSKL
jgi:hypothetical protein